MIALLLLRPPRWNIYNQAKLFFQQQRFEEAEAALNSSLRARPELRPALTLKGKLAMGLNRFDIARECFREGSIARAEVALRPVSARVFPLRRQ